MLTFWPALASLFAKWMTLCFRSCASSWSSSNLRKRALFASNSQNPGVWSSSALVCSFGRPASCRRYMMYALQGPSQAAKTSFAKQLFQKPFVVTVQNSTTLNLKDFIYGHHDALLPVGRPCRALLFTLFLFLSAHPSERQMVIRGP